MTIDDLKLLRDGHLHPTSIVGGRPTPPEKPHRGPRWAVEWGQDGTPARMVWMGLPCEARSADGWRCSGPAAHEGDHLTVEGVWIIRWTGHEPERYEARL